MANEAEITLGTVVNATAAATNAIADGAYCNSADAGSITNANTLNYPLGKIEFRATFSGTGTLVAGGTCNFYLRRTNEPSIVASSYPGKYVGSVTVDSTNTTTEQTLTLDGVPVPVGENFEIWPYNDTGKATATGWDIDFTPYTAAPGA